jgi:hypothetical protein
VAGMAKNIEHLADIVLSGHFHKFKANGVEELGVLIDNFNDVVHVARELTQINITGYQLARRMRYFSFCFFVAW